MITNLISAKLTMMDIIGHVLSKLIPNRPFHFACAAGNGISVIIPERATPAMLQECLESVFEAAGHIAEPVEVMVVVNGAPESIYADLCERYPSVRWLFFKRPLWFNGAIRKGLKAARYDWIYLLNSDMTLDCAAFAALLPWRASQVFSIASQIHFKDPSRRREETGWTRFKESCGLPEILDFPPENDLIRGTFYAGGGASLFQRTLLLRFSAGTHVYAPFYWEDVEWGTIAWRCGFESLFCPASKAQHYHRATNRLFFSEVEIDRIFQRNRIQYELRNRLLMPNNRLRNFRETRELVSALLREMIKPSVLAGILWSNLRYWTYPYYDVPLQYTWHSYYIKPWADAAGKSTIIFVTPYVIYPPSHGGAVRLQRLIASVADRYNVVLLSDEAESYTPHALGYFNPLASVHLVSGRSNDTNTEREQRIRSHSHLNLKAMLRMLIACKNPSLVQIEFSELAGLIEDRRDSIPWLLTLHEVWLSKGTRQASKDDLYESALADKFDGLIVCSEEDAQLVDNPSVHVVPNGADVHSLPYSPSPDSGPLLFIGPFRYQPNLQGICEFLEQVYPSLLESFPHLRLLVLGGHGAVDTASRIRCFSQQGVSVLDFIEHPRQILNQCSVTINPLHGVRGSCLKIAESLTAGRACISTREGARGFLHLNSPALFIADSVAEFQTHIKRLLKDVASRHCCELPSPEIMQACSWDQSSQKLLSVYHQNIRSSRRLRDPDL